MFTHFLVPLDGSQLAEAILPIARTLAQKLGAHVTLLHVVEPAAPTTVHGEPHLMHAQDAEAYLTRIAQTFTDAGVTVAWHVDVAAGGDVSKAIFAHGLELKADLILLTDHGHGGVRAMLVGSIPQKVLQSGIIPVLLVKAEEPGALPVFKCEKILAPLDGSALYQAGLDAAGDLARACGATLRLVVVIPTTGSLSPERAATGALLPSSTRAVLDLAVQGAEEYLRTKTAALEAGGLVVESNVRRGDVPQNILAEAEASSADLVVMATHGRVGIDAFWSGSIAPRVVNHARVPVLLLRVQGPEDLR